jgi:hypothetical protein
MARMKVTGALLMSCLSLTSSPAFAADQAATEGFESYSLGEVYIKGDKPPVTQEANVTNVICRTLPQRISRSTSTGP